MNPKQNHTCSHDDRDYHKATWLIKALYSFLSSPANSDFKKTHVLNLAHVHGQDVKLIYALIELGFIDYDYTIRAEEGVLWLKKTAKFYGPGAVDLEKALEKSRSGVKDYLLIQQEQTAFFDELHHRDKLFNELEAVQRGINNCLPKEHQQPPLGIMPEWLHKEQRRDALQNAINRYLNDGLYVQQEWLIEYNELTKWLNERKK